MTRRALISVLPIAVLATSAPAADSLCGPLQDFVASEMAGETHVLKFHTIWGGGFKGSDDDTFFEKRCEHYAYDPARAVCAYLMEHGAVEFAGENAKVAISCLSAKTRFSSGTELHAISFSLSYGTDNRGSNVEIEYSQDFELGGMVLAITANGY